MRKISAFTFLKIAKRRCLNKNCMLPFLKKKIKESKKTQ